MTKQTLEIHTIRFGSAWWIRDIAPTLDAWCERHGHALHIWGRDRIDPTYCADKFCVVDMLKQFLAGDSDWMGYVDADVYVHDDTPDAPVDRWRGLAAKIDGVGMKTFYRWCRTHYGAVSLEDIPHAWHNRNAGVWFCDRDAARIFLGVVEKPYIAGLQEQHQWNWWLIHAQIAGMTLMDLPERWNQWSNRPGTSCFHHLCGKGKAHKFKVVQCSVSGQHAPAPAATIPVAQAKWNWQESFDRGAYGYASAQRAHMEADDVHIDMLYKCVHLASHRPLGEKIVVEIGSYEGATTCALLTAVDQGHIAHLHLVELSPTPNLKKRIALCAHPERVTVHEKPFWEFRIESPDLVFIDGNHRWPALADTLQSLSCGASTIALHDSTGWPERKASWGSTMASNMLTAMSGRDTLTDGTRRKGLFTHRGFTVSVPEHVDLSGVKEVIDSIRYE